LYSKDEAARLKQEFWTTFGQYMALENSSEGVRINWINYKTGIKYLYFKMEADNKSVRIAIEISHPDPGIQELIFEQFKEFKNILNGYLEEEWVWDLHTNDEYGKMLTRISKVEQGRSIYRKEDWPAIITFLKPRLMALDRFWNDARDSFELFV
jgi:hypothetical protein